MSTNKMVQPAMKRPRRVCLKDIAREAKTSITTASMSLADHPGIGADTKQRIWQISERMNYKPRGRRRNDPWNGHKSVRSQRELRRVGFIMIGGGESIRNPSSAILLKTLMVQCAALGIDLNLGAIGAGPEIKRVTDCAETMARDGGGLLLEGLVGHELLAALRALRVPHVVLGQMQESNGSPTHRVCTDEIEMGRRATEFLLAAGHRRIGFVCNRVSKGSGCWRWRTGYVAALLDADVAHDPACTRIAGCHQGSMEQLVNQMLAMPDRPTAFVVPEARMALALVAAMRNRGMAIAPDAMVLGADNSKMDAYPIETFPRINYPNAAIASAALAQLRRIYEQPGLPPQNIQVGFTTNNLPGGVR